MRLLCILRVFSFKFGSIPVSVTRSAVIGTVVLVVILTIAALSLTHLTPLNSFIAAIIGTALHWFGCLVHQYGHFVTAKRTGYPATSARLWTILGTVLYPPNEPVLPPGIHIQRALGGPIASLILAVISGVIITVWLWSISEFSRFVSTFVLIDYIGLFAVGSLFPPLTFSFLTTDGGTIWQQVRQMQQAKKL
jgi:hypothetical protein